MRHVVFTANEQADHDLHMIHNSIIGNGFDCPYIIAGTRTMWCAGHGITLLDKDFDSADSSTARAWRRQERVYCWRSRSVCVDVRLGSA